MSLSKSIASGKEHRTEYGEKNQPYAKAVDYTCRNNSGCPWCYGNRTYRYRQQEEKANSSLAEYKEEGKTND